MKNLFFLSITFLFFTISNAQIVNIPDANFKDALVNQIVVDTDGDGITDDDVDTNNDGEIQQSEAEAIVFGLYLYNLSIGSLEGISSFINLRKLFCEDNQLTTLDLSQNSDLLELFSSQNQLTNLNVTQNPSLITIHCLNNQLSSLDVTQNPNLTNLLCSVNLLTSLNVTQNLNLSALICDNNQLTSLNVIQNINLSALICNNNQLTNLDVSFNPNLSRLIVHDNQLVNLNIQNGSNTILDRMFAQNNANLQCINVDDVNYANNQICDISPPNSIGWCIDPWAEYSEDCELGVEDYSRDDFVFYPNPVKDIFRIENSGTSKITSIKIYDFLGRLVFVEKDNVNQVDISHLTAGLLFVEIETEQGTGAKKIIKE